MKLILGFVLLAIATQQDLAAAASWSYFGSTGPDYWVTFDPVCNGTRQSPIDINTSFVVNQSMGTFQMQGYGDQNDGLKLSNNGHGIKVDLNIANKHAYNLSGGGLPSNYIATQFHFHWGSVNTRGSEHTIDGEHWPAELHVVHYDPIYSDLVAALTSGNGNAVVALGFHIEIGTANNTAFDNFLRYIDMVQTPGGTKVAIPSFSLRSLLPFDLDRFYRYNGSLTIPNCYETVVWTVFKAPIMISQYQMDQFRSIPSDRMDDQNNTLPTVDNYRPPLPRYGRTVYYSEPAPAGIGNPTPAPGNPTPAPGAPTPTTPTSAADPVIPMRAMLMSAICIVTVTLTQSPVDLASCMSDPGNF